MKNDSSSIIRDNSAKGIQSIELGHRILIAIQEGPEAVPLKVISSRTGMSSSAIHNYLISFIRIGMVRTDGRGLYRLDAGLVSLGMSAARQVDYFDVVRKRAVELSEKTALSVAILTWSMDGPVIIFHKPHARAHAFELRNGLVPMLTTAGGHIFATYLPSSITLPVAIRESVPATEEEGTTALQTIRNEVRSVGYANIAPPALPGYRALSVPVWDALDSVAYALAITAPANLLEGELLQIHAQALISAGRDLSRLLSASPSLWANPVS